MLCGLAVSKSLANSCKRKTTVQNIIQDQNISALEIRERDLSATGRTRRGELENDLAAGLRFSVITRHAQAIQLQGKRNSAKQVGHEHQARSEEHTSELQSRRDLVCR